MGELALLVFAALSLYNTGNQWGVQLVHYPLYASIPADGFKAYMARQNRLQVAPAIVPGVVQFLLALALPLIAPRGVSGVLVLLSVVVNVAVVVVTVLGSARLHRALERTGYDAALIDRLVSRNWSRTALYSVQAILVLVMLAQFMR
jgi:hypothetical protein